MPDPEFTTGAPPPIVGILFPGELGSTLGHLLLSRGLRVVTTLEGRSDRSARLCHSAGLEVLDSIGEVVRHADVVVSVVTPGAATAIAERVASELSRRLGRTLYIDVNSVSPVTMLQVKAILDRPNVEVVDASIHGLASRLVRDGTLYLSGPAAAEVADLVGTPPHTVLLGADIGRASLMKMLLGGVSKGLVSLLLELSEVALDYGVLDDFWVVLRTTYPGVMDLFGRLLPTYPQHVGRRIEEMAELELTISALGNRPTVIAAVRTFLARESETPTIMRALAARVPPNGSRESAPTRAS